MGRGGVCSALRPFRSHPSRHCRVGARVATCQRTRTQRLARTRLPRMARVAMLCLHAVRKHYLRRRCPFPANSPTGAYMKLSISYKHVDAHETVEKQNERHLEKLSRLLKTYEPDLVQLHGVFSKNPHNHEHSFSLNLSLPTGTLHATGMAENMRATGKKAFIELAWQPKR